MSYLAKQNIKGKEYYYLVESLSLGKGKRKQIRKYIGSEKPTDTRLSLLKSEFSLDVQKEKLRLNGFVYLDKDIINGIDRINKQFWKKYKSLSSIEKEQFEKNFITMFVYNTNSIEGSTLTLKEVELLLEEDIAPNKSMSDVYEARNAEKSINFIRNYKGEFNLSFVLKIHEIYFKDTMGEMAGKLKRRDNRVVGSRFKTTPAHLVLEELNYFFKDYELLCKTLHPLELAAWTHWKFVSIHPFQDGNGRTSRLIMNYILQLNHYPMIDIKTKDKLSYFKSLDECNKNNNAIALAKRLAKHFKKQYEYF